MKTSSTATGNGSKVCGGVWLPKGTTLNGIMLCVVQLLKTNFYSTSLKPITYCYGTIQFRPILDAFSFIRIFHL
jgi:hypothetical protein